MQVRKSCAVSAFVAFVLIACADAKANPFGQVWIDDTAANNTVTFTYFDFSPHYGFNNRVVNTFAEAPNLMPNGANDPQLLVNYDFFNPTTFSGYAFLTDAAGHWSDTIHIDLTPATSNQERVTLQFTSGQAGQSPDPDFASNSFHSGNPLANNVYVETTTLQQITEFWDPTRHVFFNPGSRDIPQGQGTIHVFDGVEVFATSRVDDDAPVATGAPLPAAAPAGLVLLGGVMGWRNRRRPAVSC